MDVRPYPLGVGLTVARGSRAGPRGRCSTHLLMFYFGHFAIPAVEGGSQRLQPRTFFSPNAQRSYYRPRPCGPLTLHWRLRGRGIGTDCEWRSGYLESPELLASGLNSCLAWLRRLTVWRPIWGPVVAMTRYRIATSPFSVPGLGPIVSHVAPCRNHD